MRLTDLIQARDGSGDDVEIRGVTLDSRQVQEGWLFAALPGAKADGRTFIGDALRSGAAAILAPSGTLLPEVDGHAVLITDDNPRRLFSQICARFFGEQPATIAAVTGTNGKTSTVDFIRQLWEAEGYKAASLGTLGLRGAVIREGSLTTPDPVTLYSTLGDMKDAGIDHLAMEASSHGLHQYRLDGVKVTAAGYTNISRDHLDYHDTMEGYLTAKARLFTDILADGGTAVLNADAPEYQELCALLEGRACRILSYGRAGNFLKIKKLRPAGNGQELALVIGEQSHNLTIPLVGAFQVMNALCALGLFAAGFDNPERAARERAGLLEKLKGVPGRLQFVPGHRRGSVYVDYAHTPDALENILQALRPHAAGRLVCLVGCGGDRDRGKRPVMARIASEMADIAVITDDNPRSEDPAAIRAEMMSGAGNNAREIGGRREAIQWAVSALREGDVLVIAGKGHEQGQIIGDKVLPFDDVEEAEKAISLANTSEAV